ncbi:TadE/TadG family type IV pilus assembly protein [Caloramator proteoclasticus]|uniref:Flp pilus assembly protein TadG n=1 Tax=Caloramator proteoclasticus DSM 10124 TaxID=1121262 RepID=A0A1M4ZX44_9CLOT|nr:TadE/TadG family type IV pilus assembly protein [Caloramator proteoclasticus]SHF22609.1 Flp pilus assembly protein TadG [Caloramator proteoclasticus DSM 10124]
MKHRKKGQALIEFSILLPIILLIVMGISEFGIMLNSYLTIQNASREGARLGIMGADDNEIVQAVYSSASHIDTNKLNVTITPNDSNRKSGETLRVRVEYEYDLLIPIIKNILGNQVELTAETAMRVE